VSVDLTALTASEARRRLDNREFSAEELTQAHLARIDQVDSQVRAFITVMRDVALEQARAADARIARGDGSLLTGIPVALKDILCTTDAPTTAASRILQGYCSVYDATVVRKLRSKTPSSWARRTPMSSPWARRPKTRPSSRHTIRGI